MPSRLTAQAMTAAEAVRVPSGQGQVVEIRKLQKKMTRCKRHDDLHPLCPQSGTVAVERRSE